MVQTSPFPLRGASLAHLSVRCYWHRMLDPFAPDPDALSDREREQSSYRLNTRNSVTCSLRAFLVGLSHLVRTANAP